MTRKAGVTPILGGAALLALCACEEVPTTTGTTSASGLRSEVEIIDGSQFTATWQDGSPTLIRLAYASTIPVSDTRLVEIAELMTGCTAVGAGVETALIGSITSVRIPAACGTGASSAGSGA